MKPLKYPWVVGLSAIGIGAVLTVFSTKNFTEKDNALKYLAPTLFFVTAFMLGLDLDARTLDAKWPGAVIGSSFLMYAVSEWAV